MCTLALARGFSVPRIEVDRERCKGCGYCVEACPQGILRMADEFNSMGYHPVECVDPSKCTGCTFCAMMCPDLVIEVFKEEKAEAKAKE
jgi:2-oxoglutarate ferredoxin oxidoreductase subunit delta